MSQTSPQTTFIYEGIQYDATHFIDKHPGGKSFITNMQAQRKDISQYFKSLHSQQAQKIFKSFPIISKNQPSFDSLQYQQIFQKVHYLYQPIWSIQILLLISLASIFIFSCFTSIKIISIFGFAFAQAVSGWMGHSMNHSRNVIVQQVGRIFASLVGGFCFQWWAPKHNMHHMFTNSQLYDDDIKHEYKVYLYPFLYLKWRFDSLLTAINSKSKLDLICILLNYLLLFYCRNNFVCFILGQLIAGFYSANVLIGNHEREKRYQSKVQTSFIDHQLITCRNYRQNNIFWLILMGGMQFQAQHHLFPQIPFYNLPKAVTIIRQQLKKINKSIVYGPVL